MEEKNQMGHTPRTHNLYIYSNKKNIRNTTLKHTINNMNIPDLDYPQILALILVSILFFSLGISLSTSSISFSAYNSAWNGASSITQKTDTLNIETDIIRDASRYSDIQSNRTVSMIFSSDKNYTKKEIEQIHQFLRRGGTLVIAEDFGNHTNTLLSGLGLKTRVDGGLLRDERYNYKESGIVIARNITNHTLTRGVDSLTLNYGSILIPGGSFVLVNSSSYGYLDVNRNGELDTNESVSRYPVVTIENIQKGKVVVTSDPSMFINTMLDREGNNRFLENIFKGKEKIILDYSHKNAIPPFMSLILSIKDSWILQVFLGILGLSIIFSVSNKIYTPIVEWIKKERVNINLTRQQIEKYIEKKHPNWEHDKTERVIKDVISSQNKTTENEDKKTKK